MSTIKSSLSIAASIAAMLLAGCTQYLDRKETVTFAAGDAVATNIATHVIDPWPPQARITRIAHDGERMQRAVERYRTNRVTDPRCAHTPPAGGSSPAASGGTPCAEGPAPVLPRAGGTVIPGAVGGSAH